MSFTPILACDARLNVPGFCVLAQREILLRETTVASSVQNKTHRLETEKFPDSWRGGLQDRCAALSFRATGSERDANRYAAADQDSPSESPVEDWNSLNPGLCFLEVQLLLR